METRPGQARRVTLHIHIPRHFPRAPCPVSDGPGAGGKATGILSAPDIDTGSGQ